ncbi:MAG: hypothetical protein P8X39_06415, partial [Desulfofustis sp.]
LHLGLGAVFLLLTVTGLALLSGNDNDTPAPVVKLENEPSIMMEPAVLESAELTVTQPSGAFAGNHSEAGPAEAAAVPADITVENEAVQPAAKQPEPLRKSSAGQYDKTGNRSEDTVVIEQGAPVPVLKDRVLKIKKEISPAAGSVVQPSARQVPPSPVAIHSSAPRLAEQRDSAPVDLRGATLGFEEDTERLAQRKQIEALHSKAKQAMQLGHLVNPAGQSAYAYYRDILTIDPHDSAAADGLRLICDKYGELAERALAAKQYAQADDYVEEGLSVIYDHSRLLDMRKRIERERREHVFELSEKARLCLDADKLSKPVSDSAYFYYSEIERIDPGNEIVARGYRKIADRYAQLADTAFNQFDYDAAENFVEEGLQIIPDHYYLLSLKDDLARSDLGRFGHSMKKKMNRLFSN